MESKNFNFVMPGLRWIILLFLSARIILSIFGALVVWDQEPVSAWIGHPIFESRKITIPDWGKLGEKLIDVWYRWDTGWYLKIAAMGYSPDDGSIIFPPLYPLLISAIAPLVGRNFLLSALVVSNISCFISLILFYYLAKLELGSDSSAKKSLLYLITFPSAFYLFAAYSESLFIMLALASWITARERKWFIAGVLAGLGALTRLQGWILVFPLTWIMINDLFTGQTTSPLKEIYKFFKKLSTSNFWDKLKRNFISGGWAVIFMPILAFLGYLMWLRLSGLGDITVAYNFIWNMKVAAPWIGLRNIYFNFVNGGLDLVDWIDVGVFIFFVAFGFNVLFKGPVAYTLYIWPTFGLMLMRDYPAHIMAGYMRYFLTFFPVFLLLAKWKIPFWLETGIISGFLILEIFLLWLFLNWYWVA